ISNNISLLFGFGSALFYSGYILVSRGRLKQTHPLGSTFYIMLAAGVALGAIHLHSFSRLQEIVANAWPVLLAISLISTVLAMALFLSGLRKLSGAETSLLSTTEPVTSILLASVFLGETLLPLQIIGAC